MMTGSPLLAMVPTSSPILIPALAVSAATLRSSALSSFSRLPAPFPTDSNFRWPKSPHYDMSWQITRPGIQQMFYSRNVVSCGCRSDVAKIPLRKDMRPDDAGNCEFVSRNSVQNVKNSACNFSKLSRSILVRSKQGSQESGERFLVEDADSFTNVADVREPKDDSRIAETVSGDVSIAIRNGAPFGRDSLRDSVEEALHYSENEVNLRKMTIHGRGRDVEAEQIGLADSQSETRGEWEGLETGSVENDQVPLPSTIERTSNKDVEREDEDRFRFRNGREVFEERAYLVGIDRKGGQGRARFGIMDSLEELTQLADTAGLAVVGSTYQKLETPNPKTYIGGGKVAELKTAIQAFKVETVIFDDELSPGQARNLEKAFGNVRVCDRTALILDIFSQRAATREASLQVELAQFEYQLPRLTKMWTHLERQAGGMVKGMGEKQIEVDKRILRTRMATLRKNLESVRQHRQQYRDRRAAVPIPVISLVGYTNAGKSTFLNRLSGADVLAEDRLFATLDPTTRRVELPSGKDCLFTDTVGFIQKLPTQLVASFRATLEEITDSSLIVHMVDISHSMAFQQIEAVESVLAELNVDHIPRLTVWNKIDTAKDPERLREKAIEGDIVCLSALTGEGMSEFYDAVSQILKDSMVWVEAVVPYAQGDLVSVIHGLGIVDKEEYMEKGTLMKAYVPLSLSRQLLPFRQACT